jgi:hypothetical protein
MAQTRLPWWALALPVLAFTGLLMLLAGPADPHAVGGAPSGSISEVLERIRAALLQRG